jgi:hypothetical protein
VTPPPKAPRGRLITRPNVILAILLGCSAITTVFAAWLTIILRSYKGPDAAVVIAVGGLANGLLGCLGIIGIVVLVLAAIILNIDHATLTAGPVNLTMDRADPPAPVVETTTTTKVTTPDPTAPA